MNSLKRLQKNNILLGSLIILIVWYVFHYTVDSRVIPSPTLTIITFIQLLGGNLLLDVGMSLYRIMISLILAILIGLPAGLFIGMNKVADRILSPVVYILYPIPKIAFLPVFMMLLGLGDAPKLVLIITIIIFPILLAVRDGVKEIPEDLFHSVRTLGLNSKMIFTNLIIPAILSKMISSLRVSIGISLSALFFCENFATTYGLGYFIMNAWSKVNYTEMFAGILALSLLGFIIFNGIDLIEKKLCPWMFLN